MNSDLIYLKAEYVKARDRFDFIDATTGKDARAELVGLAIARAWLTKKIKAEEQKLFSGGNDK